MTDDAVVLDDQCQDCGIADVTWFAPNDVWNAVMGGYIGIICPTCFIRRAETKGHNLHAWRVAPEFPSGETVNPDADNAAVLDVIHRSASPDQFEMDYIGGDRDAAGAIFDALRAMDRPTLLRALGMEQRKLFTNFHRSPTKGIVAYDGVEAWVEP